MVKLHVFEFQIRGLVGELWWGAQVTAETAEEAAELLRTRLILMDGRYYLARDGGAPLGVKGVASDYVVIAPHLIGVQSIVRVDGAGFAVMPAPAPGSPRSGGDRQAADDAS